MKTSENLKLYYSVFSLTVLILAFSLGEILSKYGVFLVGIFSCTQSEYEENGNEKTSYLDTFHSVFLCYC